MLSVNSSQVLYPFGPSKVSCTKFHGKFSSTRTSKEENKLCVSDSGLAGFEKFYIFK